MYAQLPASSTAVALGAPVEYRNVTVGSVASQGKSVPGGLVVVTLHLQPSMLQTIPAQVRATETPVSFFGDPYIELVPPSQHGHRPTPPRCDDPRVEGRSDRIASGHPREPRHPFDQAPARRARRRPDRVGQRAPGQRCVVRAQPGPGQYLLRADAAPVAHGGVEPPDVGSGGEPVRRLDTRHPADPGQPDDDGLDHRRPVLRTPTSHRGWRSPCRRGGAAPDRHPATVRRPDRRLRPVPDGHLPEPHRRSHSCSRVSTPGPTPGSRPRPRGPI